jgi:alpha-L-fucosidase
VWKDDAWQKIAEGTTIGYKRIVPFKTITTNKVRFRILSSRLQPNIGEMGLFFYNGLNEEAK